MLISDLGQQKLKWIGTGPQPDVVIMSSEKETKMAAHRASILVRFGRLPIEQGNEAKLLLLKDTRNRWVT